MSYIIANNRVIAETSTQESGKRIVFSYHRTAEAIDANRDYNLISARSGVISNAKKWTATAENGRLDDFAEEMNPGEFFVTAS